MGRTRLRPRVVKQQLPGPLTAPNSAALDRFIQIPSIYQQLAVIRAEQLYANQTLVAAAGSKGAQKWTPVPDLKVRYFSLSKITC